MKAVPTLLKFSADACTRIPNGSPGFHATGTAKSERLTTLSLDTSLSFSLPSLSLAGGDASRRKKREDSSSGDLLPLDEESGGATDEPMKEVHSLDKSTVC